MRDLPKKPTNTDDYLEALPTDQASALQKLRKQILAAVRTSSQQATYQVYVWDQAQYEASRGSSCTDILCSTWVPRRIIALCMG